MKAVVLVGVDKPLEIWDLQITDLKIGQVLVRVLVSGLCGSQLQEIGGHKGNEKFMPHLLGHEGCGIVEQVGPAVTNVKSGDLVVMHWRPGIGIESNFPTYTTGDRALSGGKVTTLSEYSIVSENRLTKVPQDTNPVFAALLGCSITTAFGLVQRESGLRFGERVLVIGCGGVGLSVILAARMRGAGEIVGFDKSNKSNLAYSNGASLFLTEIDAINGQFDLIVDTTGNVILLEKAFEMLSGVGRMLLVGQPSPGQDLKLSNASDFFAGKGRQVRATQGGSSIPQEDLTPLLRLSNLGLFSIDKLVTHRFQIDEINDAVETLRSGLAGRIVIEIGTR